MRRSVYEAAELRMWRDAFCAVLSIADPNFDYEASTEYAAKKADMALEEFRKRYPKSESGPDEGESDKMPVRISRLELPCTHGSIELTTEHGYGTHLSVWGDSARPVVVHNDAATRRFLRAALARMERDKNLDKQRESEGGR